MSLMVHLDLFDMLIRLDGAVPAAQAHLGNLETRNPLQNIMYSEPKWQIKTMLLSDLSGL